MENNAKFILKGEKMDSFERLLIKKNTLMLQ